VFYIVFLDIDHKFWLMDKWISSEMVGGHLAAIG
jgi:hypothetical protein